jgi:hypothetical protein
MIKAAFLHGQAYGTVVATAIPRIVLMKVLYLETTLNMLSDVLVALHVLLEFLAKSKHLVAMIYNPYLAYGRGDYRTKNGFYI